MKKLTLDLDAVKVESFVTRPKSNEGKGTVFAQERYTVCYTCAGMTCEANCDTLQQACTGYSVVATCGISCSEYETCAGYTCPPTQPDTCQGSCTADGCTL